MRESTNKDFPNVDSKFYPFISGKAKALFADYISRKTIIKERALA